MVVDLKTVRRCVSRVQEVSASFIWEIQQMSRRKQITTLRSETFSCDHDVAIKWRLKYLHNKHHRADNSVLSVCLESSDKFDIHCDIEWAVLDEQNETIAKGEIAQTFAQLEDVAVVSEREIEKGSRNDKLIIFIDLKGLVDVPTCNQPKQFNCNLSPNCLLGDLRCLLGDQSGDLTLLVGGAKQKVHKTIVAMRSPVLAAMLDEDKDCDELHIPDIHLDVMEQVIHYMYTDEVDDIEKMGDQLYPVACKYKLLGLQRMYEDYKMKTLTVQNVIQNLVLAEGFSGGFKTLVVDFMKSQGGKVTTTEEFQTLASTHPHLFLEVFCAIRDKNAVSNGHTAA